jgi:hypothetical protein
MEDLKYQVMEMIGALPQLDVDKRTKGDLEELIGALEMIQQDLRDEITDGQYNE